MRAASSEAPSFTSLKLRAPRWTFNALRAQQGATCTIGDNTYTYTYTEWANSNWNDQIWEVADGQKFDGGWQLDSEKNKGHIFRNIDGFAPGEEEIFSETLMDLHQVRKKMLRLFSIVSFINMPTMPIQPVARKTMPGLSVKAKT